MKKVLLNFIAITAMVMLGITANAQNKDKAAVEKLIQNYFNTLNDGDATKLTSYFTNSAALLAQGAPTATGSDQINGTFKYVFDNFSYSLKVSIGETIIQGKYAIVSSTSTGSKRIVGFPKVSSSGNQSSSDPGKRRSSVKSTMGRSRPAAPSSAWAARTPRQPSPLSCSCSTSADQRQSRIAS